MTKKEKMTKLREMYEFTGHYDKNGSKIHTGDLIKGAFCDGYVGIARVLFISEEKHKKKFPYLPQQSYYYLQGIQGKWIGYTKLRYVAPETWEVITEKEFWDLYKEDNYDNILTILHNIMKRSGKTFKETSEWWFKNTGILVNEELIGDNDE